MKNKSKAYTFVVLFPKQQECKGNRQITEVFATDNTQNSILGHWFSEMMAFILPSVKFS